MSNEQHPARRLRRGERPTEPLVFEDEPSAAEQSRATTYNGLKDMAQAAGFTSIGDAIRSAAAARPAADAGEAQLQAAAPSAPEQYEQVMGKRRRAASAGGFRNQEWNR